MDSLPHLAKLDKDELANYLANEAIIDLVANLEEDDFLSHHQERFIPYIDSFSDTYGQKMLDIGCGPGKSVNLLEELMPLGEYVGIDVSPRSIAAAQERFPYKRFHLANIYDLPQLFMPNAFRFFFAQGVLCHISKHKMHEALRAIHAVVERGGYGMISMGIGTTTEVVTEYRGRTLERPIHVHFWDEQEFRKELDNAGFDIVEPVSCYNCSVLTDIVRKR
jgi:ubiquinone/menaquinone biosynthesis C-methylase UbiE